MLRTRICDLLKIDHPVVLGGMASGTNPALVAAVTGAGGLGILGVTFLTFIYLSAVCICRTSNAPASGLRSERV